MICSGYREEIVKVLSLVDKPDEHGSCRVRYRVIVAIGDGQGISDLVKNEKERARGCQWGDHESFCDEVPCSTWIQDL